MHQQHECINDFDQPKAKSCSFVSAVGGGWGVHSVWLSFYQSFQSLGVLELTNSPIGFQTEVITECTSILLIWREEVPVLCLQLNLIESLKEISQMVGKDFPSFSHYSVELL